MTLITEDEVIHKIKQAFQITSGRLTYGMLDRHLSTNYPRQLKSAVLTKLEEEGKIEISTKPSYSHSGRLHSIKVISALGVWYES